MSVTSVSTAGTENLLWGAVKRFDVRHLYNHLTRCGLNQLLQIRQQFLTDTNSIMTRHLTPKQLSGLVATAFLAICVNARGEDWQTITVPGAWEDQADGQFEDHDGYAWYRCRVRVPPNWTDLDGRPLWYESVTLTVSKLADAHELYINGRKIGGAGSLPPNFADGQNEVRRYKIPPGSLEAGKYNTIALRVYNKSGQGGFLNDAPVLAGYFLEAVLKGTWEFRTGDDPKWATGALDKSPSHAAFDRFIKSSSALGRPSVWNPGKRISPEESLAAMTVVDDLQVEQILAEPDVAQPLSMNFDERGRLWVVEYRQYPYPAGLKMVSRNKYYRAVYDKVPPPPPNHDPGRDRISIHEDTNGDGTFDSHKTFIDGLNMATSVVRGRGGAWVLNPPYLLYYPDKNNDDVPDRDPVVHLRGFGMADTHAVPNSLHWGPDGWLYGAQGSSIASHIVVEGEQTATPAYCEGPAIWRYHPETKRFEFYAEGGGNAFGVEIDAQGRIYSGHNGNNTRGFYYVQGAFYEKGSAAKYGMPGNPYAFGTLPFMQHAPIPRFSHSFVKYEADVLPERYRGNLLSVDPLHRNVILSKIDPDGSSFATEDVDVSLQSEAITFRPVDIRVGPDGAVYIADFCEEFIAHGQHFQGMLDIESGRVYRLRAPDAASPERFDLSKRTTAELVDLLQHANKWHRRTVLRLLADRQDASVAPELLEMLNASAQQDALEAFWALNLLGRFDDALALKTLSHANPHIRRWAIRLIGDRNEASPEIAMRLVKLAGKETDVEVRLQLAASALRLPAELCLQIADELSRHDGDVVDPFIPMMLWWAIESKAASHPEQVMSLFRHSEFWRRPLVAETVVPRVMQRYAVTGARSDLVRCAQLLKLAPDDASRSQLMIGFEKAFKGRSVTSLPVELAQALTKAGGGSLSLKVRLGDEAAFTEAIRLLVKNESELATRIELAQVLGEVHKPECIPALLQLLKAGQDESLQATAMTSLQSYRDNLIANRVLALYPDLSNNLQAVAQTLLVSRTEWTQMLLKAVDAQSIDKATIPADVVRKMSIHKGDEIKSLIDRHFPNIQASTNAQMQEQISRLADVLAAKAGDVYEGRKIFTQSCGKCHLMFGEGGRIGPDLSQYQRDDVLRMLLHVVNPGAEIREGFESWTVVSADGRAVSGFLADQDKQVVVVRGTDGQNITIARDNIEEMIKQSRSLMPEGLLDKMTDQQVRDLFAFLRSAQPVR